MLLGDLIEAGPTVKNPDFFVLPNGMTSERPATGAFAVKVTRLDVLVPKYLFYVLQHLHNQGYWNGRMATPELLVRITMAQEQ